MDPSEVPAERLVPPWVFRATAALLVVCAFGGPLLWILYRTVRSSPLPPGANGAAMLRPAMILIPPGTFQMGSPADEADRDTDEAQHEVRLTRPYLIGKTEVTQGQYEAVVGENPAQYKECGPDCPVEQVSWLDAVAYCNRLSEKEGLSLCYDIRGEEVSWTDTACTGYRLPTEAEWEYAARGGRGGEVYVSTSEPKDVCRFDNVADEREKAEHPIMPTLPCDDGFAATAPVGSFQANGFHLHDMGGNVWEWCWDRYGAYQRDAEAPTGSATGEGRVLRGGAWGIFPQDARVAKRGVFGSSRRGGNGGFRVARSWPFAVSPSDPLPTRTPPDAPFLIGVSRSSDPLLSEPGTPATASPTPSP